MPALKEGAGLGDGTLGLGLFALAITALVAQPAAGALVARFGSRAIVRLGGVVYGAALCLPGLAADPLAFAATAALVGAGAGLLDVAMNVAGAEVEERSSRRMFSSLHAAYSFGAMGGAAIAGAVAGAGVDVAVHLAIGGAIVAAVVLVAARWMLPRAGHAGAGLARPTRALAVLGAVAFCALLAEGSVADWSPVYLDRDLAVGPVVAAFGLTAFQLCMGVGRLAADPVAERLGAVAVIRGGGLLAMTGLAVALAVSEPTVAIAGFAVMGIGLAGAFPLVLLAGAEGRETDAAPAIAAVSTAGYTGLLVGPAVIGMVSEATSLPAALWLVVALSAVLAALAGTARPRAA